MAGCTGACTSIQNSCPTFAPEMIGALRPPILTPKLAVVKVGGLGNAGGSATLTRTSTRSGLEWSPAFAAWPVSGRVIVKRGLQFCLEAAEKLLVSPGGL